MNAPARLFTTPPARPLHKGYESVISRLLPGAYLRDDALFVIRRIIRKLADQGPCVLIGRCADYILKGGRT